MSLPASRKQRVSAAARSSHGMTAVRGSVSAHYATSASLANALDDAKREKAIRLNAFFDTVLSERTGEGRKSS
jgi:citrate synthase